METTTDFTIQLLYLTSCVAVGCHGGYYGWPIKRILKIIGIMAVAMLVSIYALHHAA